MQRRTFLTLAGAAVAFPAAALAQQALPSLPIVAMLNAGIRSSLQVSSIDPFIEALKGQGFIVGRDVTIEYYFSEGNTDILPDLAAKAVARKPAVIIASGGIVPVQAAVALTSTIPIVFTTGVDPVANGIVASISRPGGNVTGVYFLTQDIDAKRLEILHDMLPAAHTIGVLYNPKGMPPPPVVDVGKKLGLDLQFVPASSEADIDAAFAKFGAMHVDAVLEASDPGFASWYQRIAIRSNDYKLPGIYESATFVNAGGLASYGITGLYRLAGDYAGQILHGAKPADLPVTIPTTYVMTLNLRTAKGLGIALPPNILARADQVIE